MRRAILLALFPGLALAFAACRPAARSAQSFDEIRSQVVGRTAAEVSELLGAPDLREPVLGDERWVWWSYTFLRGAQYAPEVRDRVVHLEITFQRSAGPQGARRSPAEWRVASPLGVGYLLPADRP